MTASKHGDYKPEIDGLRAIAVIAVLLFHLEVNWVSGGFVGVDIFFVISGYLVTRNILGDLKLGTFSFKRFYLRRIRRLFPALLFTITATLVAAFFILTPEHFAHLGKVSVASIFSFSNILFWSESGYFDEAKAFKPLLHTWSLGVEEQFYALWPLVLWGLFPRGRLVTALCLALLGVASLAVTQYLLPGSAATAFYWMPLRISEFAVGALLCFVSLGALTTRLRTLGAVIGVILMIAPIFLYSKDTVFPGIAAIVPCIGTALLICFGHAPLVKPILTNWLARKLGHISYSLYLVHWPIIILASYWKLGGLGAKSMALIVPLIFLSAILLHYHVEQRFRYPTASQSKTWFGSSMLLASMLIAGVGLSLHSSEGWAWRYPAHSKVVIDAVKGVGNSSDIKSAIIASYQDSFQDKDSFTRHYIIGDSMAGDTLLILKSAYPDLNLKLLEIRAVCQPVLPGNYATDFATRHSKNNCNAQRKDAFYNVQLKSAKTIFLAASWREPAASNLAEAIRYLKKNTSAKIVVFGPRATFHDVPTVALRHGREEGLAEAVDLYKSPTIDKDVQTYQTIVRAENAQYINVYKLLCGEAGVCPVISPLDGKIIYMDSAHFTLSGAQYLGDILQKNKQLL